MRLAEDEARARLTAFDHGILCTVHAERGVDAVPVAYAVDEDGYVGVPVDRVKPKASFRLQRERNLEADPRATLLVEHWDRPYTREQATYPLRSLREGKYWPPVSRIDGGYGDRNLVCACPPPEAFET